MRGGTDFISLLSNPDLLQLMLFACPDGVIATDERDRVVLYTGASEQIFGFAPFEVLQRPVSMLFASQQDFEVLRSRLAARAHVASMEVCAAHSESGPFPAAISAAVLRDRYGCYLGTVAYVRDYSKVRSIEETLRSSNEHLGNLVVELNHAARHDQLTGMLYRASAIQAAETQLLASGLTRPAFGVAIFDLDHFKSVNDSYGHLAGDEVLSAFALILQQAARQNDIVGRFGGEEFIAFLPGADVAATAGFANRVRLATESAQVVVAGEVPVRVTVSAGVSAIPSCADSLQEAIRVADDRLYGAKHEGRNRVVAHDGAHSGRSAA
ncbi:MAG: sensor domain-containing diguanylate cyclase [Dehalococcoidia bacterium]|nr:sensor domain-containing diguanylate cyclase [Dehalococcoidia bacterium]